MLRLEFRSFEMISQDGGMEGFGRAATRTLRILVPVVLVCFRALERLCLKLDFPVWTQTIPEVHKRL